MSVNDEEARTHMVEDIAQLDATIDKFLDYARPDSVALSAITLHSVVSTCVHALRSEGQMQISTHVAEDLFVMADEIELARVVSNLLENARRYGRTPGDETTVLDITAEATDTWVNLQLRDHGQGVPPEQIARLIQPFFRGDAARTAAAGAGLGLSIVDKTVQRMGGAFALFNAEPESGGGLVARVELRRANPPADEARGMRNQA